MLDYKYWNPGIGRKHCIQVCIVMARPQYPKIYTKLFITIRTCTIRMYLVNHDRCPFFRVALYVFFPTITENSHEQNSSESPF